MKQSKGSTPVEEDIDTLWIVGHDEVFIFNPFMEKAKMTTLMSLSIKISKDQTFGGFQLEDGKKLVWQIIPAGEENRKSFEVVERCKKLDAFIESIGGPLLPDDFKSLSKEEVHER